MRKIHLASIAALMVLSFGISACDGEGNEGNETKISSNGSNDSHKNSENCMSCHISGGSGEGWFTAAGSVYKANGTTENANGFIRLFTEPNGGGTEVAKIEVDALGNFFTTKKIDYGSGLYPSFESASGNKKFMGSTTISGSCNSCHGVSAPKIALD